MVKTTSAKTWRYIVFSVETLFDLFGGSDLHADLRLFTSDLSVTSYSEEVEKKKSLEVGRGES